METTPLALLPLGTLRNLVVQARLRIARRGDHNAVTTVITILAELDRRGATYGF